MARKDWTDSGHKLTDDPAFNELREIQAWLKAGDIEQLEFALQAVDSFPHGKDNFYGLHWIGYAVASGSLESVNWMIENNVSLQVKCDDGYPPLIACIEEGGKDKLQMLSTLIEYGADIDEQGINGWTPLHIAASRDDEKSMHLLLVAGADRTITTKIDDDTTAEEEARKSGHVKSADYIANFSA